MQYTKRAILFLLIMLVHTVLLTVCVSLIPVFQNFSDEIYDVFGWVTSALYLSLPVLHIVLGALCIHSAEKARKHKVHPIINTAIIILAAIMIVVAIVIGLVFMYGILKYF